MTQPLSEIKIVCSYCAEILFFDWWYKGGNDLISLLLINCDVIIKNFRTDFFTYCRRKSSTRQTCSHKGPLAKPASQFDTLGRLLVSNHK